MKNDAEFKRQMRLDINLKMKKFFPGKTLSLRRLTEGRFRRRKWSYFLTGFYFKDGRKIISLKGFLDEREKS